MDCHRITFDFAPRIVLLSYSNAALSGTFIWPPFIYGETIVTCYAAGGQIESGDTDVYLSFDDNKIEWYTSNVNTQGNRSTFNYFWCAIGYPFPFSPKFVWITSNLQNVQMVGQQILIDMFIEYGDRLSTSFQSGCGLAALNRGNSCFGMKSADGKTWSWYHTQDQYEQNNGSGITYFWTAMG